MESKKGFFDVFFQRGQFDNLKAAIICFVIASILMLNLFQNPLVHISDSFVFDDVSTFRTGFFYDYFFNFSNIFSSIITVVGFVLFVLYQVVMVNHFVTTWSKRYLVMILGAIIAFYVLITVVVPFVERKEVQYLSGSEIGKLVYSRNYNEAYGIVQGSKASDYAKTYMTAQISLQKKLDYPNDFEAEELLLSDANALNYEMIENGNILVNMDRGIISRIYDETGRNHQLTSIEKFAQEERTKGFVYIMGIAAFLLIGAYNLMIYRRVLGM